MSEKVKLSVLVIDDNPDHFDSMKFLVNDHSKIYYFDKLEIINFNDDIIHRVRNGYDIVFLDIIDEQLGGQRIPKGIDVLQKLRQCDSKNKPIVMLTVYCSPLVDNMS